MAEITLGDLLAWEPRLRLPTSRPLNDADLDRDVSWVVTARATAPMLPPLRGGELVILPRRIIAESGVSLPLLLREMAGHHAAAVILDGLPNGISPLPTIVTPSAPPELEADLNRLLTERRGELYRAGTELERLLTDLAGNSAGLARMLSEVAAALTVPLSVADVRGGTLAASITDLAPPQHATANGWHGDWFAVPLKEERTLWLGPVPSSQRALARLVGPRIGTAIEAALFRASQSRPRGPARAVAIGTLFSPMEREAAVARSVTLGLPPDGTFRVALGQRCMEASELPRVLAPWGTFHEAGSLDGCPAAVAELRRDPLADDAATARRPGAVTMRINGDSGRVSTRGWIAISGPATGVEHLAGAAREVRFVAALLSAGLITAPVARFDSIAEIGPFRLLFPLWGTATLTSFASDALGELIHRDRRGTLRQTLLAYLETGGSHVEAAARLGIHRNTLAYRLKQIATLSGHDPADASCRLLLHLGLLATMLPSDG
ncbi:MAG: helix-turn-helix domain-containing protein [Thermomicrobiales bacterium]